MLSSVYIAGKLGEILADGVRLVDVDGLLPGPDGAFKSFSIPVYSNMGRGSYFFEAPRGSLVIVKGRLEPKEGMGLVVINEIDEIYSNKVGLEKSEVVEQ